MRRLVLLFCWCVVLFIYVVLPMSFVVEPLLGFDDVVTTRKVRGYGWRLTDDGKQYFITLSPDANRPDGPECPVSQTIFEQMQVGLQVEVIEKRGLVWGLVYHRELRVK